MGAELGRVIDVVAREKNLDRQVIVEAVEAAMVAAAKKMMHTEADNIEGQFNEDTGEVELFEFKDVVEVVEDPETQITLEEAHAVDPDAEIGDSLGFKLDTSEFGRIAAQNAKQIIMQKIREAEKQLILEEYGDRIGEIVSGIVRRVVEGAVIIELGRAEGILRRRDQLPGETYRPGDRVRALLVDVSVEGRGPEIVLSRSHPDFLKRLFEFEVPEIYEGTVEIRAVAREPGNRSKVAVYSNDSDVDPVGAAVGVRGSRVQNIVQELRGEKIDIIPWSDDPARLIENALSPAQISQVIIDEDEHLMEVVVPDDQLSLAIGRKGQNVKLAVQLTGWNIDIRGESQVLEMSRRAKRLLGHIPEITDTAIELLFHAGITRIEDVAEMDVQDVAEATGLREDRLELYASGAQKLIADLGPEGIEALVAEAEPEEASDQAQADAAAEDVGDQVESAEETPAAEDTHSEAEKADDAAGPVAEPEPVASAEEQE
ncbi:MAG: transcription termination/antitermination protein NusA [Candidatus Dadabacteria bacterium]|nr:MAG: transcription termination/antitermination protein NusA [Candidatus Dadabacteria bacterium]